MSFIDNTSKSAPTGLRKMLHFNWPLVLLMIIVAGIGFVMLFSVAGGSITPWAEPQMKRFAIGFTLMIIVAMTPLWAWRNLAFFGFFGTLGLLILVELIGTQGGGAQRWIDLGFMSLQPSELMKITLVITLATYYDWLSMERVSRPLWLLPPIIIIMLPVFLVLRQPDLGTAILLLTAGGLMMFLAGVHWAYFAAIIVLGLSLIVAVLQSRGTDWQILKDYQYTRIDTFLDPASDPLGAGYHITQSKIALGSGGWAGRGYMQGTQSQLHFLPEKHTDFIFTTLAEEFGFIGGFSLLVLYALIIFYCIASALKNKDRFAALLTLGIAVTFFLFFAVNMSMVMGLAPVVGVPLPLVSYGGSAMLVLMIGFGLVHSAHIHRPR